MFHSLKEALRIIGEIDATTITTALPPPVDTGDLDSTDSYKPPRFDKQFSLEIYVLLKSFCCCQTCVRTTHSIKKNYLTSFGTLQKIHFSTKHRHVPLPARILSPPRFVPGEFDRTLISQRGGKKSVFLMCVYAPFLLLLLLLCFLLLRLKRDAKWFIGNIWQLVSQSHLIRATTVVHHRL